MFSLIIVLIVSIIGVAVGSGWFYNASLWVLIITGLATVIAVVVSVTNTKDNRDKHSDNIQVSKKKKKNYMGPMVAMFGDDELLDFYLVEEMEIAEKKKRAAKRGEVYDPDEDPDNLFR